MTKFNNDQFEFYGGYLNYVTDEGERKFVARFKYMRAGQGSFRTFLRKNFTVEEYFAATDGDALANAPLNVLEAKGYLLPHVAKMCKRAGYPATPEGRDAMIDANIAARAVEA